jgi:hypothetical protein
VERRDHASACPFRTGGVGTLVPAARLNQWGLLATGIGTCSRRSRPRSIPGAVSCARWWTDEERGADLCEDPTGEFVLLRSSA